MVKGIGGANGKEFYYGRSTADGLEAGASEGFDQKGFQIRAASILEEKGKHWTGLDAIGLEHGVGEHLYPLWRATTIADIYAIEFTG